MKIPNYSCVTMLLGEVWKLLLIERAQGEESMTIQNFSNRAAVS